MKNLLLSIILLILSDVLFSQSHSTKLMVGGGVSIPTSPNNFTKYWEVGYNYGGGLGYYLNNYLSIHGYFEYNYFLLNKKQLIIDSDASNLGINIVDGNTSLVLFSGNLKLNLVKNNKAFSPYFLYGFGYLQYQTEDAEISFAEQPEPSIKKGFTQNLFAINLGTGLDFTISSCISIFVDFRYVIGIVKDDSNTSYIPIRIGLSYGF